MCSIVSFLVFFFFSSRRRHTRCSRDWSSDVCSSDLPPGGADLAARERGPELGEQRALGLAVALPLLGGERLDALTQRHARRPAASRALPGPRAGGPGSALARAPAAAGTALPTVP